MCLAPHETILLRLRILLDVRLSGRFPLEGQ
ncbi:hypothetical protein CBM2592_A260134 [Cupriavidus taiwanensis]|nr:hypothetical protein CBM2592_A260134 [Cupriavidus taiwanensis]SOZ24347.1 hypothetical protein CBM2608_A300129 [Cupriavidus taiwanensis]SOZ59123.1 hypothetical protein CBM2617_A300134 [Cupriavidus taiwanensis]SOZ81054.1 hypothetical protein CBM2622_A240134 [Cupriavidus taiwanensis]SOZ89327.1 hypothetical protein CBM2621_A240132 [Cupriavidus taiwanensis]